MDGVHFILSCYVNTTGGHNIFICLVEIQMSLCKNNNNNHTAHAPKQRPTEMFTGVNKILFSGPPNCFLVPESKLFDFLHFQGLSGLPSRWASDNLAKCLELEGEKMDSHDP